MVQVPRVLPRILRVPARGASHCYVFLADMIRWQLPQLFARTRILDHTAFRATRNTNLYVDDDEVENLLTAIEQELRRRRRGEAVRLEVRAPIGDRLEQEMMEVFDLEPNDVYECDGQVNLHRVMQLLELENDDRLKAPPFQSAVHPSLVEPAKYFQVVRAGDVLLHHPFESFESVVNFVEQAADDPRVLAIKQTLYRTSEDSPIARALLRAAEQGKQVTVVVELKARFDEEKNIRWARRMEEAGVQIVFGDVRLKTHCKLILVVRREEDGIRRYAHIGTGNYNPTTARQYTDIGLLTADPEVTAALATATVSFGEWSTGLEPALDRFPNLGAPVRPNGHQLIPNETTIKAGGTVNFIIAGFHHILVYGNGTQPDDIDATLTVPTTNQPGPPLINDPENRVYRGLDPTSAGPGRGRAVPEPGEPTSSSAGCSRTSSTRCGGG